MTLLTAAVIVLTVVVAIDLVFSAAVIRRLRQIELRISDLSPNTSASLAIGSPLPEFTSESGELTRADLVGPTLIGFFSAGCRYCPTQAEQLAHRAGEFEESGVRVVSILTIDEDVEDEISPTLRKAGLLITERGPGAVMAAFAVSSTPTFLLYDDAGRLVSQGHSITDAIPG